MKDYPKVFIVILNYNGKDCIKNCLASVFNSDYPNFEVVVVDNDSKDGSFELAKDLFQKAHYIKNPANLGFSAGNNIGIRFALEKMTDYIFLFNNDAIMERNSLSALMEESEKIPEVGIVSPLILQKDSGKIWFAGGTIDWIKMKTHHDKIEPEKNKLSLSFKTEYVSGCAMLIKKDVFKKIGLFDEDYFLYYEDADFSYRAANNGFELFVVPKSKVRHSEKSGFDMKTKTYWLVISGMIFFQKNTSFFLRPWIFFYTLSRKIKNKIDVACNKGIYAQEVKKAYDDYAQWKHKRLSL